MTVTAGPWEQLARERKARAIADTLVRVIPTLLADDIDGMDEGGRRAAAHLARVSPPSDECWSLVVAELRRMGR